MKITEITVQPMGYIYDEQDMLTLIGQIAGECYGSDVADTQRCVKRALGCIKRGHHSPFEHVNVTLKCCVDRGVSHALVRHRHCAFQQGSTIYHRFDRITVVGNDDMSSQEKDLYNYSECVYNELLKETNNPGYARNVLPNALATSLIITTNIRQWVYMIHRRNGPGDSENMHVWCQKTRVWFEGAYPKTMEAFDGWYEGHPL